MFKTGRPRLGRLVQSERASNPCDKSPRYIRIVSACARIARGQMDGSPNKCSPWVAYGVRDGYSLYKGKLFGRTIEHSTWSPTLFWSTERKGWVYAQQFWQLTTEEDEKIHMLIKHESLPLTVIPTIADQYLTISRDVPQCFAQVQPSDTCFS